MQPPALPLAAALALSLALAACLPATRPPVPSGEDDYATYCAACHGASGRGDGAGAQGMRPRPTDLTRLSASNGGAFPGTRVMAKIWGYTGGRDGGSPMPAFGPLLDGEAVLYDGGDGILTPTPLRLVQIAEHLRGVQR
ncbi:MAG TPA: cytochrome C [Paracoccaceae bacterium]|nr:cytochrome C [Paracoccaceae bacterium]